MSAVRQAGSTHGAVRVRVGALELDALGRAQALDAIVELVRQGRGGTVYTPNVDHIVQAEHDQTFREVYGRASLSLVDGTPVLWAARLLGTPLPEKLSGSDMFEPLLERAVREKLRVVLLGGGPGVGELAAQNLRARLPDLQLVDTLAPRLGLSATDEERACVERLRQAKADLIFVCLGAPKQELFSDRNRQALAPAVLVCFGAAVDFAAGTLPRAPGWMSSAGLEWAFRLAREPRRLAARYLLRDPEFLKIVAVQALSRGD
ncbi:MAG TPA: WecB/TagA/CpsF family glycosyltransferase [Polyangiaceae bacterium]|nr:WecB/TagA/CpsF family glycosyltransferase [Polyangiaceae bacterium]